MMRRAWCARSGIAPPPARRLPRKAAPERRPGMASFIRGESFPRPSDSGSARGPAACGLPSGSAAAGSGDGGPETAASPTRAGSNSDTSLRAPCSASNILLIVLPVEPTPSRFHRLGRSARRARLAAGTRRAPPRPAAGHLPPALSAPTGAGDGRRAVAVLYRRPRHGGGNQSQVPRRFADMARGHQGGFSENAVMTALSQSAFTSRGMPRDHSAISE